MFASKDLFFSKPSGYQISRSVRLRSSASAYFNRTFGTPTNEKIWTWSAWVKRGSLGVLSSLFNASTGASPAYDGFRFNTSDQLQFFTGGAVTVNLVTTSVFRDPSAWYHIVLSYNATTTTVTIYVNGVAQTTTGTTVSNTTYSFNHASTLHSIGAQVVNGVYTAGTYFDGYLTEINFIDGQALGASSFGQTNPVTGVWQPIKYTGTYGTNGFYLNFSDNSSNTATTIGKDYSGNGNNWTPNNISVTAGVTYDSMIDVPTLYADGGNGRGNYAVLNPLAWRTVYSNTPPTNGNLTCSSADNSRYFTATISSSGSYYFEITATTVSGNGISATIWQEENPQTSAISALSYTSSLGVVSVLGTTVFTGATFTSGDVIGLAHNTTAGTVAVYKNNTLQGIATGLPITINLFAGCTVGVSSVANFNFGQRPFTYTPPTGFVALNTQNLPAPTISNGANYMASTLYTGNNTGQTITNTVNGASFQPDFLWIKVRSNTYSNVLADSVRGVSAYLNSDNTGAEGTNSELISLNSNGFTLGATGSQARNVSGQTYVGWQWKAGGTAVSNTAGSITSSVSANPTAGFSVVTYTGINLAATVGHGLGVAPKMIIVKTRNSADIWCVYTSTTGAGNYLALNSTIASTANTAVWNNTSPTSSVFSIANSSATGSVQNYVAYCFSEVAGYSKFGSYTGNGSTDGPFVFTNFRPRWIMVKRTDSTSDWYIWDTSRDTYNVEAATLFADTSGAETSATSIDDLSNGFKCRSATVVNVSTATYIYAAFAENPLKYSLAR